MRKIWWKILCIGLLTWALLAGMLVPLKTGITKVTPSVVKAGETINVTVEGYNSRWSNTAKTTAWLHIDSFYVNTKNGKKEENVRPYAIQSTSGKVLDERHLSFTFSVPPHLPLSNENESASILVDVEGTRQAIRPLAILISQDSINPSVGQAAWNAPMTIIDFWSFEFPYRNILYETIRNTFYHVPMWFVMFILFGIAIFHGIKYLIKKNIYHDIAAASYTSAGVLFGFLGLFSGGLWANYTWGKPFPLDIKIIMTYTCLAIYLAYFLLRMSFDNLEQRARISAVYSVFAFASLVPLLYVVPKLAPDSLHPGNGGNPAFGTQDMDNTMRMVFYPASLGWILLGVWIGTLVFRYRLLDEKVKMKV